MNKLSARSEEKAQALKHVIWHIPTSLPVSEPSQVCSMLVCTPQSKNQAGTLSLLAVTLQQPTRTTLCIQFRTPPVTTYILWTYMPVSHRHYLSSQLADNLMNSFFIYIALSLAHLVLLLCFSETASLARDPPLD